MKILHVFPRSLFINPYLFFIKSNFDSSKHIFISTDIGANIEIEKKYYEEFEIYNISTFKLQDIKVLMHLLDTLSYDRIIFHSVYLNYLLLAILFRKKVLKKASLVLWGGTDSSRFSVKKSNWKYFFHGLVYEKLRKTVYKNVLTIASVIPEDFENIKKTYELNALYKKVKYPLPTIASCLHSDFKQVKDSKLRIQIGHSGSSKGKLLESYELISRFKEQDIEIYSPLSYGDEKYILEAIKKGKEIFGNKFIPLTKMMTGQEYADLIVSMDILVMNTDIQQGLGNFYSHFYANKKVYLNRDSILWEFFQNNGFQLYELEEVSNITYDKFKEINCSIIQNNHEKSESFFDNVELINLWENLFSESIFECEE